MLLRFFEVPPDGITELSVGFLDDVVGNSDVDVGVSSCQPRLNCWNLHQSFTANDKHSVCLNQYDINEIIYLLQSSSTQQTTTKSLRSFLFSFPFV